MKRRQDLPRPLFRQEFSDWMEKLRWEKNVQNRIFYLIGESLYNDLTNGELCAEPFNPYVSLYESIEVDYDAIKATSILHEVSDLLDVAMQNAKDTDYWYKLNVYKISWEIYSEFIETVILPKNKEADKSVEHSGYQNCNQSTPSTVNNEWTTNIKVLSELLSKIQIIKKGLEYDYYTQTKDSGCLDYYLSHKEYQMPIGIWDFGSLECDEVITSKTKELLSSYTDISINKFDGCYDDLIIPIFYQLNEYFARGCFTNGVPFDFINIIQGLIDNENHQIPARFDDAFQLLKIVKSILLNNKSLFAHNWFDMFAELIEMYSRYLEQDYQYYIDPWEDGFVKEDNCDNENTTSDPAEANLAIPGDISAILKYKPGCKEYNEAIANLHVIENRTHVAESRKSRMAEISDEIDNKIWVAVETECLRDIVSTDNPYFDFSGFDIDFEGIGNSNIVAAKDSENPVADFMLLTGGLENYNIKQNDAIRIDLKVPSTFNADALPRILNDLSGAMYHYLNVNISSIPDCMVIVTRANPAREKDDFELKLYKILRYDMYKDLYYNAYDVNY